MPNISLNSQLSLFCSCYKGCESVKALEVVKCDVETFNEMPTCVEQATLPVHLSQCEAILNISVHKFSEQ